jgi:hypothetical protein
MIESINPVKLLGVLGGAFLALVFIPPRTIRGFLRRSLSAVVFGSLFGHLVLVKLEWPATDENIMAAYATASFTSWWLMGALKKAASQFKFMK